jgi:RNA polymerase sigma-70 factor (ECF subfamily)
MTVDAMMLLPATLPMERTAPPKRAPRPMDEARFEAFYRANAGSLWSYIYRLTGDPATADDLLQKAFYRFLRANPQMASEDHLRRYLFRTATNLAFDHFRETKRERGREIIVDEPVSRDSADLRHDMMRTFAELKPRERALLWLAHVEESEHADIAEALGVKTKSVKVLLFRARKRLGDLLRKKGIVS